MLCWWLAEESVLPCWWLALVWLQHMKSKCSEQLTDDAPKGSYAQVQKQHCSCVLRVVW